MRYCCRPQSIKSLTSASDLRMAEVRCLCLHAYEGMLRTLVVRAATDTGSDDHVHKRAVKTLSAYFRQRCRGQRGGWNREVLCVLLSVGVAELWQPRRDRGTTLCFVESRRTTNDVDRLNLKM